MKLLIAGLLAVSALSACQPAPDRASFTDAGFCSGAAGAFCAFVNAPLQLAADIVRLPRRPYPFHPLAKDLSFVDRQQRVWIAPKGILTDGASIPPVFVKVVGQPTDPSFVKTGAIHDSYCGIGNESSPFYHTRPWRETHRMFYEALRVGGTSETVAKTMFAAVYMGGPRWTLLRSAPVVSTQGTVEGSRSARDSVDRLDLSHVPVASLQRSLSGVVAQIEAENPTIQEIENLVDGAVSDVLTEFPAVSVDRAGNPGGEEEHGYEEDDPVTGGTGTEESSQTGYL